jgi:hypothetical protein
VKRPKVLVGGEAEDDRRQPTGDGRNRSDEGGLADAFALERGMMKFCSTMVALQHRYNGSNIKYQCPFPILTLLEG